MLILGIDPGLDGAGAFVGPDSAVVFDLPTVAIAQGTTTRRLHAPGLKDQVLAHYGGQNVRVVIEALAAGGARGSAAQTVGSQYRTRGTIEATLELLGLTVEEVSPARWKRFYGLMGKTDATATAKALELARGFYPGLHSQLKFAKDHNRAEALLIARWAQKVLVPEAFV